MIIYESKIGDSLSIGFLFNEAFDMSRLESVNVCLGSRIYPHTIIDQMIRCELKSEDTNKLNGTLKLTLEIDDSVLGKKKREIGEVKFNVSNSQGNNESVNTGYDVVVPITINEQHITTGDVLYNYVKGENGDVTADNIDLAIAEGYSEEGSILDEDLIIGQDKKKWTFLSIFDVIKSKLGISVGGVATKFLNQLGEFVNIVIGGSVQSQLYYMDSSSDITPLYKRLDYIPYAEESEISHSLTTTEQLLATFIYDSPIATDTIDAGTWYSTVIGKVSSAAGETTIRLEFFMRSSAGVETVLFSKTSDEINNTDYSEIKGNAVNGAFVVDAESNLGVKIYGVTTGSNKTIYFKTGGQNLSYLQIPLKMRHNNLRGLNEDPDYQHLTTSELNQVKYLDLTSEKTTPIAADSLGLWDSVTSTFKRITVANLLTFLNSKYVIYQIFNEHVNDTQNPHSVSKAQVGLMNVDNTSDADKPISTAARTALNAKVTANAAITGATKTKVTYDSKGLVTGGADLAEADIPTLSLSKTSGLEAQITVPQYVSIRAQGDASGILALNVTTNLAHTATITGGFFYTDAAGTLGQSTSFSMVIGANQLYIKCAVDALISLKNITRFNSISSNSANVPIINALSFSNLCAYVSLGGSNTVSGSLVIPSGNTNFLLHGSNTVSGSLVIPSGNTNFSLHGSNTVSGSLVIPSGNTNFSLGGSNTCTLNLTNTPNSCTYLDLNSNSGGNYTYNTSSGLKTWAQNMRRIYIRPKTVTWTSAMTDALLIDLALVTTWVTEKLIDLRGNCGARTSASDAAVATLTANGVSVLTN